MSVDNKFLVRDKITLKVTGLGSSGEGVGKTDGFTVFAHGEHHPINRKTKKET